jgi:sulfite exporter TauE/SafE
MIGTEYLAALGLGLAGAGHCLGMCGGIASALNLGGGLGLPATLAYHTGRICSYALLGVLVGALTGLGDLPAWTIGLRYLAGILLIAMGLYIADWWRGLAWLERAGASLWRPVQSLSRHWLPVRHAYQAGLLGLCWGLMPCGLIYSSLAWAATAQDPLRSGTLMLVFGIGTLPAMVATSLGAQSLQSFLRRRGLKLAIALLLIASGAWTLYLIVSHSGHSAMQQPSQSHQHHSSLQSQLNQGPLS